MEKSLKYYEDNIKKIEKSLKELEKELLVFSVIRFSIVILCLVLCYWFFKESNIEGIGVAIFGSASIFLIVAFFHNEKLNKKKKILLSLEYNQKGIQRLNSEWKKFNDDGKEFIDINHNFSSDLDIFGSNSLFQWINTTKTSFGRLNLADTLNIKELPDKYEIYDRQDAIKELVKKREFCEKIYIQATELKKDEDKNIQDLLLWAKNKKNIDFTIKYIAYFFIAITTIMIFLTVIRKIPISYLILDLIINYLVIKLLTKNLSDVIYLFIKNKSQIKQYSNILNYIQNEEFKSKKLISIQRKFLVSGTNCDKEMTKLKNIVSWIGDSQGNAYYLLINVLFMSDIFILQNLEKWRIDNGKNLEIWLKAMGEVEALVSLSNIAFEHERWAYPKISLDKEFAAIDIAHPLLGDRAKGNSFSFRENEKVALITGSNMSGKSTFLRTIGFNIILTYLGLPTFSKNFMCGIFNLHTCMRTQDNLEENISSFYAEILRIKLVIGAAKKGERVFFLLDEIFKGTNSKDRHEGAKILIEQLVRADGMGLVSTHDFELCDLEKQKSWLANYNFREYYEENNIKFDYVLRKGQSTTQNAKHLMKLAGIDIE